MDFIKIQDNFYYVYAYYLNNVPIYIGRGKDNRAIYHLKECYKSDKKHLYFYNKLRKILENNQEYQIKILRENLSYQESQVVEEILIELCGRKDINTGCLYNLTDGGEGTKGYKASKEKIEKLRELTKIRTNTPEYKKWFKENIACQKLEKVIQYSINGEFIKIWNSITEASNYYNTHNSNLHMALSDINKTAKNYRWTRYEENYKLELPPIDKPKRTRIYKINKILAIFKDGSQKVFNSAKEAGVKLNLKHNSIRAVCNGSENRKQHNGIIFKYI